MNCVPKKGSGVSFAANCYGFMRYLFERHTGIRGCFASLILWNWLFWDKKKPSSPREAPIVKNMHTKTHPQKWGKSRSIFLAFTCVLFYCGYRFTLKDMACIWESSGKKSVEIIFLWRRKNKRKATFSSKIYRLGTACGIKMSKKLNYFLLIFF